MLFSEECLLIGNRIVEQASGFDKALQSLRFQLPSSDVRLVDHDRAEQDPMPQMAVFDQLPKMPAYCAVRLAPINPAEIRKLLVTEKPPFPGGLQDYR